MIGRNVNSKDAIQGLGRESGRPRKKGLEEVNRDARSMGSDTGGQP
jgi:hypothetical protein